MRKSSSQSRVASVIFAVSASLSTTPGGLAGSVRTM
jgi:hypothetical protein